MDARQKPEPTNDNDFNDDLDDDQIIDLDQIVNGDDDDDIIDLTNILKQPEQASDAGDEPNEAAIASMDTINAPVDIGESEDPDNDIIDLMNGAAADAPQQGAPAPTSTDKEEEVIDLMDVAAADTPEQGAPAPASADKEEEVIDLMDVAAADAPQQGAPAPTFADKEEEVIDLMDVTAADTPQQGAPTSPSTDVGETRIDLSDTGDDSVVPQTADTGAVTVGHDDSTAFESGDKAVEEMAPMAGPDDESTPLSEKEISDEKQILEPASQATQAGQPSGDHVDAGEAIHAAALASVISPTPTRAAEPMPLTDQQVEDALEKVIEKIYGERIEQLLIQTIEKTVKREIEKIKNALLEDSDDQER